MLRDLLRFNREAPALVGANGSGPTLGAFLEAGGYSREFVDRLIVPQASAVWSADPAQMWDLPAGFLAEFFDNHGMFGLRGRPRWRTIVGGAKPYVERPDGAVRRPDPRRTRRCGRSAGPRRGRAASGEPASTTSSSPRTPTRRSRCSPTRPRAEHEDPRGDPLPAQRGGAAHRSPPAAPPSPRLGELELPPRARPADRTTVTYHMNRLQSLRSLSELCVTLNRTEPDRPGAGDRHDPLRAPGLHPGGRRRAAALARDERRAAPTTAAPTGATDSTRTAWRARCGSARRWGAPRAASTRAGCATAASRRLSTGSAIRCTCMYLDLDELPELFERSRLVGAIARFRRRRPSRRLHAAAARRGARPRRGPHRTAARGPVRVLTQLRHFGVSFNPVSFYYCFDVRRAGRSRGGARSPTRRGASATTYVLDGERRRQGVARLAVPRHGGRSYGWRVREPGQALQVHIENRRRAVSRRRSRCSGVSSTRSSCAVCWSATRRRRSRCSPGSTCRRCG